jgi:hypothetical protein
MYIDCKDYAFVSIARLIVCKSTGDNERQQRRWCRDCADYFYKERYSSSDTLTSSKKTSNQYSALLYDEI